MDKKHELGICKALSFEECLMYKAKKYPEIVENVTRIVGEIDSAVQGKDKQVETPIASAQSTANAPTAPATVDTPTAAATVDTPTTAATVDTPTTPATVDDEVPGTTTKAVVEEWADFHQTLNFSGQQSHLPWAAAGFAAGIGAGALFVARATSGLRRTHDVCMDGTECMAAE